MESIYFRSKFWNSSTVRKLTPNERLLYIYLITNKETKPSGIYKIFWDYHQYEVGLPKKNVKKCLLSLAQKQKIVLFEDWVFVRHFLEETFNLKTAILSSKIKTAIQKQLASENVPLGLVACFHSIYKDLSIPYPYPIAQIIDYRLEILDFRLEIRDGFSDDPDIKNCPEHGMFKTEKCRHCVRTELFKTQFWGTYPKRKGIRSGKQDALDVFLDLPAKIIDQVIIGCRYYAVFIKITGTYAKDPTTWLNKKVWEEWQEPYQPEPPKETPTARRLRESREGGICD